MGHALNTALYGGWLHLNLEIHDPAFIVGNTIAKGPRFAVIVCIKDTKLF
jgi:hypothetical protein